MFECPLCSAKIVCGDGFLTDKEICEALNLPHEPGRLALAMLDQQRGRAGHPFPAKDPLFGNKRYYPAVRAWLANRYGIATLSPHQPDGPENLNVSKDRRGAGPRLALTR